MSGSPFPAEGFVFALLLVVLGPTPLLLAVGIFVVAVLLVAGGGQGSGSRRPGWPIQACERPKETLTVFGLRFWGSVGPSPEVAPDCVAGPLMAVVAPGLLLCPGLPCS